MRKIRIGNDIQVSWEVRTGGEAVSLEGRSLRVWVRSAYSRQEVESFSVEGCVLTFTYPAEMQKTTGARAVVLEDMTEGSARRTLCADEAFTLVAHTSEEDCSCGCGDGVGNAAAQGEDFGKYLVSLKSNILVGRPGLSAYDLWLKDGHTGTMEDYMRWLQQPAADAASSVTEAEKKRVEAESGRSEAERLRDEAEAERNTNEGKRKTAETERQTAFSDGMKKLGDKEQEVDTAVGEMKTAVGNAIAEATNKTDEAVRRVTETEDSVKRTEALRVNEENKRTAAETGRIDAESERQTAESGRAKAESQRQSAETARNAAEGSRIKSEKERIKSEELRAAAESDRQTAEQQRVTTEQSRTTAEADRTEAELLREAAERKRVTAEQTRTETFNQQTDSITTALRNAETATEGAEKVNATLSDANVLTITDRDGAAKSIDLASQEDVAGIVDDVQHFNETMGAYTERESITLTAVEQNKAVSADGVKVSKQGWAIAEFTAEKGNVYLFKPGVTDGSVCIFAEKITSVETRGIDYTYTYNEDGTAATATATYLGKTHVYTYTWGTDAQGNKTATITEDGAEVAALPMTYETQVGTYAPLVRLNADAELPKDGYCRYMSHFKGNSAIKIAVSYKVGAADLVMKVTRDGVLASISTQLGNLSQKEDETRSKVEEYHRSYIDVMFKQEWKQMNVDGRNYTVPAMTKTRFYPKRSFHISLPYCAKACQWVDASHLDVSQMTSMYCAFIDCENLTHIDVSGWDTSNLTSIEGIFSGCKNLEELDVSGWDTSKMNNISGAFHSCASLKRLDVSGWDVSNVTSLDYVFSITSVTSLDVSGWDTHNVRSMSNFISWIPVTSLDMSKWNTENVSSMNGAFWYCQKLKTLDLTGWCLKSMRGEQDGIFVGLSALTTLKLGPNFFNAPDLTYLNFDCMAWNDASVKESLVTNSYDRTANGQGNLTLKLSYATSHALTEDDIATMTAKGYVIIS